MRDQSVKCDADYGEDSENSQSPPPPDSRAQMSIVDAKKAELLMLSQLLAHTSALNQSLSITEKNLRELNEGMKMSLIAVDQWKTALNLTSLVAQDIHGPPAEGDVVKLVKLDKH
ncbi:hypothetical protein SARC_04686 [Sphaeroforma arctica JP610]|uniref:Uncharacterized protein n=1 Tax=Sphaeroforma arctica JP610 TaxID=667725 RepID=A0A0L0G483_9EUKA|nr:hypothetical protein SARC_04686 [Sphaeroforma arctica JP610]KNC83038.1 hypothetical protein SARC_04686 [Sphaeroforma arctica JP610]|eukprot:XP_014156940.1 hypothetical protein SARC_04686 [Sphaeroforma arctica JP610]